MTSSPFHDGERTAQRWAGVPASKGSFIRPFMPEQHRELFEKLPFILVGSVDEHLATLLFQADPSLYPRSRWRSGVCGGTQLGRLKQELKVDLLLARAPRERSTAWFVDVAGCTKSGM